MESIEDIVRIISVDMDETLFSCTPCFTNIFYYVLYKQELL